MAFTIKENDTGPPYQVTLTRTVAGVTSNMDLTNATAVKFKMRKTGTVGIPKVNAVMTYTDRANGGVQHAWAVGDTDTPGTFDLEFEVTWSDGTVQTIPNDSYLSVTVKGDLDSS